VDPQEGPTDSVIFISATYIWRPKLLGTLRRQRAAKPGAALSNESLSRSMFCSPKRSSVGHKSTLNHPPRTSARYRQETRMRSLVRKRPRGFRSLVRFVFFGSFSPFSILSEARTCIYPRNMDRITCVLSCAPKAPRNNRC
jgi:hypothetical protein